MSAAAVIIIRQRHIMKYLREHGALSPESGVALDVIPYSDRWYFRRLLNWGAIRQEKGRYYLDEDRARDYEAQRWTRIAVFLAVVLVLMLLIAVSSA